MPRMLSLRRRAYQSATASSRRVGVTAWLIDPAHATRPRECAEETSLAQVMNAAPLKLAFDVGLVSDIGDFVGRDFDS